MPSLPQPVRKKLMSALPRPASRKSLDAGEKSEKKEDSVKNARRNSLRAADTLSDLLGAIGRPSFFRQKSGKEKSRKKKTAMTGIGLDGCLRTEDGIEYLRKFCRQFPGQRKYLEFWLLVGGKGGFKDAWNTRSEDERAKDAEKIAAQYLRAGSEHLLNEGGIEPMPDPLPSISVGLFNEAARLAHVILAKEVRVACSRRRADEGGRGCTSWDMGEHTRPCAAAARPEASPVPARPAVAPGIHGPRPPHPLARAPHVSNQPAFAFFLARAGLAEI